MATTNPPSPAMLLMGVAGLYVAQSVIGGMTWTGLPAVMREAGVSLDRIGLVSLIALPWVLKFLWAPAVERYRLPVAGRNRSGSIVLVGGLVSVLGLISVGMLDASNWTGLFTILIVVAFAASTVDIACDGFAVQSLAQRHHGWANAAQVGGAYLGAALGGGLFLYLVGTSDWRIATWSMAGLVVLLGMPFLFRVVRRMPVEARHHVPSLGHALGRPLLRRGLIVAAIFVLAQKSALGMIAPFLVDKGVELTTVGILNGVGTLLIGSAAALIGGACVRSWGIRPVLLLALALQAAALSLLAVAGWTDAIPVPVLMGVAIGSTSGIMAFGFVGLYAQFMRWSDPRQAGVDFTLFQSMDALVSLAGGVVAGYLAEAFGYGPLFIGASFVALASVPVIMRFADR
ncbi:Major facilitator superfamily MFS_1 [Pseudorhizobium banfieldiae]|uniref:Major facilitator superfamily MFS_1 n=1 Tax=Pseudorhizobium banfieldiae TaxID=1125847 RepID=L0NFY6_9HYPH|nr:MFS transporter [Pseudorhizobium banfieldiae]CAD6611224.1 MFS transporter [arsenite-oxidising bacterium NT-25]CCF19731.1 Major facilitator superfamily MFS_1 [Pseudorhizobium banfieldiae]